MNNIKSYINGLIGTDKKFKASALKSAIYADYLSSGIMLFNNDATAPLVMEGNLVDVLSSRISEGSLGRVALDKVKALQDSYDAAKKKDSKLSYTFGVKFNDVGSVSNTFRIFKSAIEGTGELIDGEFKAKSNNKNLLQEFTAHETLIVENMVRFEEMFEKQYGKKNPNEDAVTSLATILTLRAIAQEGEEDNIDNLAEQIYPFIVKTIKVAGKKYVGDDNLYSMALELAEKRISELNSGLNRKAFAVDLRALKADEKIYQEANKCNNLFKDYRINLYVVGENPTVGYVNEEGKFAHCQIRNMDYDMFEDMNKLILSSVIDTDEEVLAAMLANLIVIENTNKFTTVAKKQLSMAFALPLVQAMNKLGDEEATKIFNDVVSKLSKIDILPIDKNIFVAPSREDEVTLEESQEIQDEIVDTIDGEVYEEVVEPVVTEQTPVKKELKVEDIRKKLIKKIFSENNKYYKKIGDGKVKADIRVQAHEDVIGIAGLLNLNSKILVAGPKEYVEQEKISKALPSMVIGEFAEEYLVKLAEEIAKNPEVSNDAIKTAKKDIAKFYTSRVKKRQISIAQVSQDEKNATRDDR